MKPTSHLRMRMRWRPILCIWSMTLFGLLTYGSMRMNSTRFDSGTHPLHPHNRYFWWGSIRLDSEPLGERHILKPWVEESDAECVGTPLYIWVHPGWIERALILTALPAFFLAVVITHGLARLGISELLSFMSAMPLLTLAWFYLIGWLLDRWQHKRLLNRATPNKDMASPRPRPN